MFKNNRSAFTLIELALVIANIGILAAISIPAFLGSREKAKVRLLKQELSKIEYPRFPWPPPKASASHVLPLDKFRKTTSDALYLRDIEQKLESALDSSGYYSKSYFSVPDGFAMVTRLEQIYPDGRPKEEPSRWEIEIEPLSIFDWTQYLRALFKANTGYYRIIVFIVTPHPFSQTNITVTRQEAMDWLRAGSNQLSDSIGEREFSEKYVCTALIYEFEKPKGKNAILLVPSNLLGRKHLEKAKLWNALEE